MSVATSDEGSRVLGAPLQVAFDYTRSTGPVLGAFFGALRDRRVLGSRTSDGRVVVPPVEFDPVNHEPIRADDLVEVSSTGTVETWTWVSEPVPGQPLDEPFAFAMIRLDGADAPMLHAVKADGPSSMSTGMQVQVHWTDDPQARITDIAYFEPVEAGAAASAASGLPEKTGAPNHPGSSVAGGPGPSTVAPASSVRPDASAPSPAGTGGEPVTGIITPVELDYLYEASPEESAFFRGLAEGRLLGQRCPKCGKVYVPPRGACPVDGVPTKEEVELPDTGIVTTFCIVNVPFTGQKIQIPYVSAYVLLDGADIAFLHLIQEIPADEVRMGMRVKAVWKPREEWGTTVENIMHFKPTGEPDADYETFKAHL
jgi:uncharacterized OB-fold protein